MLSIESLGPRDLTLFLNETPLNTSYQNVPQDVVLLLFILPVVQRVISLAGRKVINWKFTNPKSSVKCTTPGTPFLDYNDNKVQAGNSFLPCGNSRIPPELIQRFLEKIDSPTGDFVLKILHVAGCTYLQTNYIVPVGMYGAARVACEFFKQRSIVIISEDESLPIPREDSLPELEHLTSDEPLVVEPLEPVEACKTLNTKEKERIGDGSTDPTKQTSSAVVELTELCKTPLELRKEQFGDLSVLPNEIIKLIFDRYVPYKTIKCSTEVEINGLKFQEIKLLRPYPFISKGFRALADSYHFVKKFFPKQFVDAVGIDCLRGVPLFNLESTVSKNADRLEDPEWAKQVKSGVYQTDQIKDPLGRSLRGFAKVDQRTLYAEIPEKPAQGVIPEIPVLAEIPEKPILSVKIIDPPLKGIPLLIRKDLGIGCQVNFYVKAEELQQNRFHFYIDAANRPGFLATYRIKYAVDGQTHLANAVCGFHQIDAQRPDLWIWHDFTGPSIVSKVNGDVFEIEHHTTVQNLRWFYFMRSENGLLTPDSVGNIEWFKEFYKGDEVKWLSPGGASAHKNAPILQARKFEPIPVDVNADNKIPKIYSKITGVVSSTVQWFKSLT